MPGKEDYPDLPPLPTDFVMPDNLSMDLSDALKQVRADTYNEIREQVGRLMKLSCVLVAPHKLHTVQLAAGIKRHVLVDTCEDVDYGPLYRVIINNELGVSNELTQDSDTAHLFIYDQRIARDSDMFASTSTHTSRPDPFSPWEDHEAYGPHVYMKNGAVQCEPHPNYASPRIAPMPVDQVSMLDVQEGLNYTLDVLSSLNENTYASSWEA